MEALDPEYLEQEEQEVTITRKITRKMTKESKFSPQKTKLIK